MTIVYIRALNLFRAAVLAASSSFSILQQMFFLKSDYETLLCLPVKRKSLPQRAYRYRTERKMVDLLMQYWDIFSFNFFVISESLNLLIIKIVCRSFTLIFLSNIIKINFSFYRKQGKIKAGHIFLVGWVVVWDGLCKT